MFAQMLNRVYGGPANLDDLKWVPAHTCVKVILPEMD